MRARHAGAIAAGAALFALALLFGAFAADPLSIVHAVDAARLARRGAVTQRFRSRHDGTMLSVVQLGRLSAPVPVVLVHGLGASVDYWTGTALALAKSGRTVLMLDMPGSGASAAPKTSGGYSLKARVAALSSLVSALALDKVDLVGHSLGGWAAGLYALAEPYHVRRLVLVDAAGFFAPSAADGDALRRTIAPRGRADAGGLVNLLFARPPFPRSGFVVSALARMYREPSVSETAALLPAADVLSGREAELPRDTVLIWGEDDSFLPIADARRAAPRIPGGRLLVITGVGHDAPLEAPARFREALAEALPKEGAR